MEVGLRAERRAQPPHKVNLNEPQLTIMVQALKTCAAISVLPQWKARSPCCMHL